MKQLLWSVLTLCCLVACESEADQVLVEALAAPTFAGDWQLIEQKVSIGGPAMWEKVDDGDKFTLKSDGSFADFQLFSNDCTTGNYEVTTDELILSYDCEGSTPFTYALQKENADIILSPKTIICTDGCEYKYRKISD